jgi:histidyl-tRNA synthetase
MDHEGRGLKSQMKRADKLGARYVAIMGEDELAEDVWTVRDMTASSQERVSDVKLAEYLEEKIRGRDAG